MNGGAATREQIYAALFAKLQGAYAWNFSSRRLRHWEEVPWADQPALFVVQEHEKAELNIHGMPLKWALNAKVWVYCNVGETQDPAVTASTQVNAAVDAIDAVLKATREGDRQTLGGLVYNCFIDGALETDEGWLGPQTVCRIPIKIIAPA